MARRARSLPDASAASRSRISPLVPGDNAQWRWARGKLRDTPGNVAMGCAMKTVMLYTVFLFPGIRNGIDARIVGHTRVKGGLPNRYKGRSRNDLLEEAYSANIGRIMCRSGRRQAFHLCQHFRANNDRFTMDTAMHRLEGNSIKQREV